MNGAFSSVLPDGFRPSGAPYSDGTASKCNAWSSQKTTTSPTGTAPLYTDYLQYVLQPNINTTSLLKVFIHTGSNAADSGSLLVTSDDSISAPFVDVTMSYRDKTIRNTTSVCIMNTIDSVGLGIYVSLRTDSLVSDVLILTDGLVPRHPMPRRPRLRRSTSSSIYHHPYSWTLYPRSYPDSHRTSESRIHTSRPISVV